MKRRDFLAHTSKAVIVPAIAGPYGARAYSKVNNRLANMLNSVIETDKVLVLVFLSGGNDGLNTVVPLDQLSALSNARPHVFIPENKLLKLDGTNLALHPSLSEFKQLFEEEKLSIVQNVGYEDQNFSHFRSTDIWMTASDANELITNGWTGRYLDYEYPNYPFDYPNEIMPDPLAVEIGYSSSLLFQGPTSSMGMVIQDPTWFYDLIDNVDDPVPDTPAGERLAYLRLVAKQSELYGQVVKDAAEKVNDQLDYPDNNRLAQQLKIVARLIAGGLKTRLYLVQLGGFDTHDTQVQTGDTTQGAHANLLGMLSKGVKAFMDDANHLGIQNRILGMTFSEFGRRIVSNASNGTDHGAAAPLFYFGDQINGGVYGNNPVIPPNAMYNDNLPFEFDFRQIYATVFEQWFCVPKTDIESSLLGDFESLSIVKDSECMPTSVHDENQLAGMSVLEVYPSLAQSEITIAFETSTIEVFIDLIGQDGRQIKVLVNGVDNIGKHKIRTQVNHLAPGTYYIRYQSRNIVQSKVFVKM